MEPLENGEVELSQQTFDFTIPMTGIDVELPEIGTGNTEIPSGVYKAFDNIMFNQLDIDPESCSLIGSFTGICNYTGKTVSLETMKSAFEDYKASGKFTPGLGGTVTDGASFAVKWFNKEFGTNIAMNVIPLNSTTLYNALSSGSPVVTGIHYGPSYFKNEQDDGQIENTIGTIGSNGHILSIVKMNTTDTNFKQIKFSENYFGKLPFNIIYVKDFEGMRSLFFNSCVYFTGK